MLNRVLIVVIAVAAMASGFWFAQSSKTPSWGINDSEPAFQGWLVKPPRKVVMPALTRDDGAAFEQKDISGHWSLFFFGYTNCPDVCPTTLNVLAQAKKKMQGEFPEVFFVSVDPQRDTVDMLADYVRYFDPGFRGVTGSPENIKALSLQVSVVYMSVPADSDGDNYLVEHSSSILLFNPQGELHAFLSAPHTSESILHSLNAILAR